ncbi:MAG: ATP-binding protein [Polyangiales bacterium]
MQRRHDDVVMAVHDDDDDDDGGRMAMAPPKPLDVTPSSLAWRVAGTYLAFGALWILTSDSVLAAIAPGASAHMYVSMVKGWAFIVVTTALLYVTLRRHIARWMFESAARARAEAAAHRDAERMREYVENAPLGVFVLNTRGVVLDANPAGVAMLGTEPRGLSVFELVAADGRDGLGEALRAVAADGRYDGELRVLLPRGGALWLYVRAVVLTNQRTLVFAFDVTARKQLEAQFLQAQKMEAIGTLAGGIAHDFNNVLTVILGCASMLDLDDLSPAESRELSAQVREAAERASNLTRQLLLFSRKQAPRHATLDLSAVVTNVARMLRRIVGEGVHLEAACDPGLPSVRGDVGMIEQVLMNLAVNARDAMPQGGRLEIRTSGVALDDAAAARIPGARAGAFVTVEVTDSGEGIPAEVLPHIFEPFFTTKEVGHGTGLGLATVRAIVEQHLGWIELRSRPGEGTTFRVAFPVDAGAASSVEPQRQSLRSGDGRLLLVEDDVAVRAGLSRMLRRAGNDVHECDDGESALEAWASTPAGFDLLITDVVLPGPQSGLDLAEVLRARSPSLAVVFMSGYDVDTTRVRESVTLQKPFAAGTLTAAARDALAARSLTAC